MLVDDMETDNYINDMILREAGIEHIYQFKSGQSAIEFLENLNRNYAFMEDCMPQLIFLDLNMPLMDGFQFLREFERFENDFKKHIRFVILTSSNDPDDVKTALSNKNVIKYLNKPLNENAVSEVLETLSAHLVAI